MTCQVERNCVGSAVTEWLSNVLQTSITHALVSKRHEIKVSIEMVAFVFCMLAISLPTVALCGKTTCTASTVNKGESGNVTCHFSENLNHTRDTIVVHKLGDNNTEIEAQDNSSSQTIAIGLGSLVGILILIVIVMGLLFGKRIRTRFTQTRPNHRTSHILLIDQTRKGESLDDPARKDQSMDTVRTLREKPCHVLILGPSGSGKSATCNTILGDDLFQIGDEFATTTQTANVNKARDGLLEVMDTPDISCNMTEEQQRVELSAWKQFTSNAPHIIVLVVRCGKAYTQQEYRYYQKIKQFWEDSSLFCQRLVVAFTFGDQLKSDIEEVLKNTSSQELREVLEDAKNRYVVFSNEGSPLEQEKAVTKLLRFAHNQGDGEDGAVDPDKRKDVQNSCDVEYSLLLMGKTANDRCVVGNTLLGIDDFRIVDIPDITDSRFTRAKQQKHMLKWKQLAAPGPDAILLTVKCDADYTAEDYDIYQQMQQLWGDPYAFCNLLVLAFVVGDQEGFDMENILGSSMSSELKSVLEDAGGRSVVFKKQSSADEKVQTVENLTEIVQKLRRNYHPLINPPDIIHGQASGN
ncbi:hypothetical protein BaRGS_00018498 [Batillaria attramentaria]|uniref:AIG1-type G domain-containing protein n=1 Tax=Batillaria attramentaria TaxID=370345 RepID=A0ABD0KT18_9CAEN